MRQCNDHLFCCTCILLAQHFVQCFIHGPWRGYVILSATVIHIKVWSIHSTVRIAWDEASTTLMIMKFISHHRSQVRARAWLRSHRIIIINVLAMLALIIWKIETSRRCIHAANNRIVLHWTLSRFCLDAVSMPAVRLRRKSLKLCIIDKNITSWTWWHVRRWTTVCC